VSRNLFAELRRRNVIRMGGLYLVAAWLIVQVSGTVLPMFDAPGWLPRSIVFLLAIGFIPALIFSWVFELTPEGLRRESEVPAERSIMPQTGQRMNHMIIAVLVLALGFFRLRQIRAGAEARGGIDVVRARRRRERSDDCGGHGGE